MNIQDPRFCLAPFTSLFIAANGYAFPCCSHHGSDVVLGNIFTDSVDEILCGARATFNRKRSLDLTLPCNSCSYAHKTNNPKNLSFGPKDVIRWEYGQLGKLQVEVGYFCNSRCSFCDQPHGSKGSLPFEKIKEIILKCKPNFVELQGGEVYYNKGGPEFIEWLGDNKNGATAFMHTNCVLPTQFAHLCSDVFDFISLNMYGASHSTFQAVTGLKFEKATDFIEHLVSLRDRKGRAEELTLAFKMTTCPTTFHELPDAVELADRLKVDSARFAFDAFVHKFVARYNNEFTARIWDRLNDAIDNARIEVHTKNVEAFGFVRGPKVLKSRSAEINAIRHDAHFKAIL